APPTASPRFGGSDRRESHVDPRRVTMRRRRPPYERTTRLRLTQAPSLKTVFSTREAAIPINGQEFIVRASRCSRALRLSALRCRSSDVMPHTRSRDPLEHAADGPALSESVTTKPRVRARKGTRKTEAFKN